jgi:predicted DNA-binding antitoxin AbrB/MazE fold protein
VVYSCKGKDKTLNSSQNESNFDHFQWSYPMETETIEAIYEQGGFRVVDPGKLKLNEGQKVRLLVEPIKEPEDILGLATRVYDGLTDDQIDAIEQHIRRREDFFGKRSLA